MEGSAVIEYWPRAEAPDGKTCYECWGEFHVPERSVALMLYSMTGIGGGDPAYDIGDLSRLGTARYERDGDIIASKPMKIECDDITDAVQRLKSPETMHLGLRAALETVKALGPHSRLVFWLTI